MAHFARLDGNNIVLMVCVVSNADLLNDRGEEDEALGIAVCENVVGPGPWIQTSYSGRFRHHFAGIGDTYDEQNDVFIKPKPHPTSVLDDNFNWVPPIPAPNDGGPYQWNEQTQTWDTIPTE